MSFYINLAIVFVEVAKNLHRKEENSNLPIIQYTNI